MAGYSPDFQSYIGRVGDNGNGKLVDLVRQVFIRFPAALKKYWKVFAVGFVLGNLMDVEQKSRLEITLEEIVSETKRLNQAWTNERAPIKGVSSR